MLNTARYELYTEDGDSEIVVFPAHYEVCGRCLGSGKHVNPSIDGHGLSQEDFDADPDFEEAYFNGVYDVTCYECKGKRVVSVVDPATLSPELKVKWEALVEQWRQEAEDRKLSEMERRMGA